MRCGWTTAATSVAVVVLVASVIRTNPLVLALLLVLATAHGTLLAWSVGRRRASSGAGAGVLGAGARVGLLVVASLQLMSVSVPLWFACVVLLAAASPVGRPVLLALVCLGADSGHAGGHGRPA